MNNFFAKSAMTLFCVFSITMPINASAASQCTGLSSSACSSKSSQCTWRKSSVNKNGVKTKAHCRALPGKANSKNSTSKAKSSTATTTKKKTKAVKKKTTKASTSKAKAAKKKDK